MKVIKTSVISLDFENRFEEFEDIIDISALSYITSNIYFKADMFETIEEYEDNITLYLTNGQSFELENKNILKKLLKDLEKSK